MDNLVERLAQTPVLSKLSESQRAELGKLAIYREYDKGETLAVVGEMWPKLILVDRGVIHLVKISTVARSLNLLTLQSGDVFWGHSLFVDQPLPASLEVHESCGVYEWNRSVILPLLKNNNEALWEVLQVFIERTYHASDFIEGLAFQPLSGRLARLLLERFEGNEQQPIARDMTLDEMAATIGTTREVVCRLLYRFVDEGLIHLTRTELIFTNKAKLEKVASSN